MHVRVLVAAYLFQTGYGHFSFFWLKGDFSLYRVCQVSFRPSATFIRSLHGAVAVLSRALFPRQVLFRLNFLVLVLCVVMDRPYQFYYFVPLVTFWFFIIYGTLVLWPQILQKKANSRFQRLERSGVRHSWSRWLMLGFLSPGGGVWYMGVLVKLLGLLLFIYFFAFSQVRDREMIPLDAFKLFGSSVQTRPF